MIRCYAAGVGLGDVARILKLWLKAAHALPSGVYNVTFTVERPGVPGVSK